MRLLSLRPQLNPIIVREVRTRMRGVRPYAILTVFLLLLSAVAYMFYQLMMQQARMGMTLMSAHVGQGLFNGLALCEIFLVVFLAPALTSGAISGEREQLTYDMLLATPLSPTRILWGKLIGALSYLLLLIVAAVPIFSVVLMFGGVEPRTMLKALALLLTTTLTFGMVGLTCSALLRRTSRATLVSYIAILLLLASTTLPAVVWGQFSNPIGQMPPPWLVYLNPFSAVFSLTNVSFNTEISSYYGYFDSFAGLPVATLLAPGVLYYGPNGQVLMPTYRATMICFLALTLLLGWLSTHLVLPRRRWWPRLFDLGFALLFAAGLGLAYLARNWWYLAPPVV
ncbi:ABC transporter permease subunit [Candidatus Gracilibacteria bacterium]|nr:ABC transporter permease subunit [Candidatus Gracilibacteria bacterium]